MTRVYGRLSLGLGRPLWDWLHAEAARQGLTVAEVVRRVLDERRERVGEMT